MYHSTTVPPQSLQLASAKLLAPVFAANPEPPEPLQLGVGHSRTVHMASLGARTPCSAPGLSFLLAWILGDP